MLGGSSGPHDVPVSLRDGIAMTETDKPHGISVVPPTVPIRNINVPDPTTGSEPESKDVVQDAESKPEDPDKAAKDGLA